MFQTNKMARKYQEEFAQLLEKQFETGTQVANELFLTENLSYYGFGVLYDQRQDGVQIDTELKHKLGFYKFQEEGVYSLSPQIIDEVAKLGEDFTNAAILGIVSAPLEAKNTSGHGAPIHYINSVLLIDTKGNYWIMETGKIEDSMFKSRIEGTRLFPVTRNATKIRHSDQGEPRLQSAIIWTLNPSILPKNLQDKYEPRMLKASSTRLKMFVAGRTFLKWPSL